MAPLRRASPRACCRFRAPAMAVAVAIIIIRRPTRTLAQQRGRPSSFPPPHSQRQRQREEPHAPQEPQSPAQVCRASDDDIDGPIVRPRLDLSGGGLLPDRINATIRELEGIPRRTEDRAEYEDEEGYFAALRELDGIPADPTTPSVALRDIERSLEDLLASSSSLSSPSPPQGQGQGRGNAGTRTLLQEALRAVAEARAAFFSGSGSGSRSGGDAASASYLCRTTGGLREAQVPLDKARKKGGRTNAFGTSELGRLIVGLQTSIAVTAQRIAEGIVDRAGAAGVESGLLTAARERMRQGEAALGPERPNYRVATNAFDDALGLVSNSLVFDIEVFKDGVIDALSGNVVGYSVSIAYQGQLYESGQADGDARTNADAPQTAHSPTKEMHVVSVSKPITAIVLLRLLELNGETPDSLIQPYLPSDWTFNDGSDTLTFRQLFTHTSNFGQNGMGNTYDALKDGLDTYDGSEDMCGDNDIGAMNFCYNNGNFGIMRIAASRLLGFDLGVFNNESADSTSTAIFLSYAKDLYNTIGVGVNCQSEDLTQTIQYNFPAGNAMGYVEPDRRPECGGIGWHASSNELAAIMAYLRMTNDLLTDQARGWMQDGYLGFMDTANYGFIDDKFGTYYMHGGDWFHTSGEAHACALAFPIQLQVGLIINSERADAMPYQCQVVQDAFEDAWVAVT